MAILSGVFEPENSEQMQILHQAEMSSHHAKSVYTSCFGRVHLSSILCSLWLVHYPGNRQWNRLSYWRTSPLAKKCLHPPTSNSRPAVPSIKSRIYKTGTRKPEVIQLYLLAGQWNLKNLSLQGTSWPSERIWVSKGSFIGSFSTASLAVPQWYGEEL